MRWRVLQSLPRRRVRCRLRWPDRRRHRGGTGCGRPVQGAGRIAAGCFGRGQGLGVCCRGGRGCGSCGQGTDGDALAGAEADAAGAALSRKESEELSRELASLRGERDALVGESSRQTAQLDVAYFYFLLASFFALLFASCARTRSGHLLRVWGAFGWSRHWRCGLQVLQFDLCFGLPLRSFLLHLQAIFELHAVQILLSFPHLHAAEGVQRMQCALCL